MTSRKLARNAAFTALAFGLAILAWASGVDRMTRAAPALAQSVPPPLRAEAWRAETSLALLNGSKRAQALAARAVSADPIDPTATSLLGAARFQRGDGPGAAAAFRVAGTLGWRDQRTQLYWLVAALQVRDYPVATERLDALLRQAPGYDDAGQLLSRLGATPEGRAALARRLAARSTWFPVYLTGFEGLSAAQLADRAAVLDDPAMARAKVTCGEIGPLAGALYAKDRAVEARRLWSNHCGGRQSLLVDGGFEAARLNETSPFAWQFAGEGGLDLRLEPGAKGKGQALVAASTLPLRRVVAVQVLQLAAGRYRIGWSARDAAGSPSPRIAARLTCQRDQGPWLDPATQADGTRTALAVVTAECPLQWLELALDPRAGAVTLDEVSLAPVR